MKEIPLTQGKVAIVDDADYEWLSQWKWCANKRAQGNWYAQRNSSRKIFHRCIYMHRVIANPPEGMVVDHINGNGLDNRRENLRVCTQHQNTINRAKLRNNTSGYTGVRLFKRNLNKKYNAFIFVDGRQYSLGYYADPVQAAHAYDEAAKKYFGEFARLNFPNE